MGEPLDHPDAAVSIVPGFQCALGTGTLQMAEPLEPSVAMLRNQQPRTLDEIIASATAKAEQINRQTEPVLPQKEKAITHD